MLTNVKQTIRSEKEEKQVINERECNINGIKEVCVICAGQVVQECVHFDVLRELPFLEERVFSHVSNRLLNKHEYWHKNGNIRLGYFVDLLVQAREIVVKYRKKEGYPTSGIVIFPNDEKGEIFITPNESGKLSIKLATDA